MDRTGQVEGAGPPREEADVDFSGARAASRISGDYLLRSLQLLRNMSWGDAMSGLVALAVIQSNVAYLDQGAAPRGEYASMDEAPPDDLRRPVSVLSLSQTIGLPYETTRRHVAKLIKAGVCQRVKGGIIVPAAVLSSEGHREQLQRNLTNLRRMFRNLRAAGIELD